MWILFLSQVLSVYSICRKVTYNDQTYTAYEHDESLKGCKTRHVFNIGDKTFCISNDQQMKKSPVTCKKREGVTSDKIRQCGFDCENKMAADMKEIVGGQDETHVTWHVAIVEKGTPPPSGVACGGSLLNPTTIITAANCFFDFDTGEMLPLNHWELWFGLLDVADQDKVVKRDLLNIKVHPDFKYDIANTFSDYHDIAILQIEPVNTTAFKPICLPPDDADSYAGICAKTTGWGWSNTTKNQMVEPTVLQGLLQKTITNEECFRFYEGDKIYLVKPHRICYSNVEGQNACVGDAGGPLVFTYHDREKKTYTSRIIGISAFASRPCEAKTPSIFTRVSKYVDWIKKEVDGDLPAMCEDKEIFYNYCNYCC